MTQRYSNCLVLPSICPVPPGDWQPSRSVMGRILTICATLGSVSAGVAWLGALVAMTQWYKLSDQSCQASTAAQSDDPLSHILSLEAFCITSLAVTAFVFTVFFLQLFYHERLAHEVLLEELADAAATTHFHSLLVSTLCSSFTHTLLLLFNILITLTLILLCFLGLSAITEASPQWANSQSEQQWDAGCTMRLQLGVYLVALNFIGACMFFVATGWRCISRCWTDEDSTPSTSGPGSGSGVGGLMRTAAEARGGGADKKGKGRKRNVKYSAVEGEDEADDDELFDAEALDGGSDEHSDIQRGGLQMATVAEEELEMMDMLDKHNKPAHKTTKDTTAAATVAGKNVPSILPPPRVSDAAEKEEESKSVGLPRRC